MKIILFGLLVKAVELLGAIELKHKQKICCMDRCVA